MCIWDTIIICATVFCSVTMVCMTVRDIKICEIKNSGTGILSRLFNVKKSNEQEDE